MKKITRITLEEVMAQPLTDSQKAELEHVSQMRDEDIDFSDAPEVTDEDYATGRMRIMRRGGARPGAGRKATDCVHVSLRMPTSMHKRFQEIAAKRKTSFTNIVLEHLQPPAPAKQRLTARARG